MDEGKICNKCGRLLPIENFRLCKGQFGNPYYRGYCKSCEVEYGREYKEKKREKEFTFLDDFEIIAKRKFKDIHKERILDISKTDLDITLLGTDEIFVKLMDYKDTWLSNYGRMIRYTYGKYALLRGSFCNNELRYSAPKNVFSDGKWIYKSTYLYAPKAVMETFIVNEDKANNIYIWHRGYDKRDCYYKNLYPLNQEQFRIVKSHFVNTGDDSEAFILKVMNDIRYKPNSWSKKVMEPVMYGVGYHGLLYKNSYCESYQRWHYMMNRCYSKAIHELQPEYEGCTVCEEWKNYSNFKLWYDEHVQVWKALDENFEIDKDILIKGNKIYSPETVCLVPKLINSLFTNGKKSRGDYPLGVYFDKDKNKYRACMSFMGDRIKLGTFDTVEEAFARYKVYKEDFIKDIAEQYKGKIPDKVYRAMMNWVVEITD
ncbi:MAG: hypothetical protein IKK33_15715 [Lachnospiraceae bacterium]|nr:hypothetical protein [Lachnospiraceae bacterium]